MVDDPCDFLTSSPAPADADFRAALQRRTSRIIRLRWWMMRLAVVAVLVVVYLAGLLTPRPSISLREPEPAPPAAPAEPPPVLPSPEPDAPAVALEYRALESERGRAELYRRAADRYLTEDDLASAARCYRLALVEGADGAVRADDSWLFLAIKNARLKEK